MRPYHDKLRLQEMVKERCLDEKVAAKFADKFNKISWCAARKGDLFCGNMPDGMGFLIYHMEGNRLIATMSLEEACGLVQPAFDMTNASPEDLKTLLKDRA